MTPFPPAMRARLKEIAEDAMPHDLTCPRSDNWQDPICDCGWLEATVRLTEDVLVLFADLPQAPEASRRDVEMDDSDWRYEGKQLERQLDRWGVPTATGGVILSLLGRVLALRAVPPAEVPPPAPAAREEIDFGTAEEVIAGLDRIGAHNRALVEVEYTCGRIKEDGWLSPLSHSEICSYRLSTPSLGDA